MSDWTDAEIKAVLAESATEERRKEYGLSPGNLARLVLDVRKEMFDESKRPFCHCGDSIEPLTDASCGTCYACIRNQRDEHRAALVKVTTERDVAQEQYQFMVNRAAEEKLDGYRELGARAAQAENERDDARSWRESAVKYADKLTGALRNWAVKRQYARHEEYHQAQSEVLAIIAKVEKGEA